MSRFICNECGAQFNNPATLRRYFQTDNEALLDTLLGTSSREDKRCPYCGCLDIAEMEPCPTCDGGWKTEDEHVCYKCHLRNVGIIRMLAMRNKAETLKDMDSILEGESLLNFRD